MPAVKRKYRIWHAGGDHIHEQPWHGSYIYDKEMALVMRHTLNRLHKTDRYRFNIESLAQAKARIKLERAAEARKKKRAKK